LRFYLQKKQKQAHWDNYGNGTTEVKDVNPRKGRELIKAEVEQTTNTIQLKMPEFRQHKVRVILNAMLSVNTTYTLAIERLENFGDAYLLSGDDIEILFKYTDTSAEGEEHAVVQTNMNVDATQFHVELDRRDRMSPEER
jgi:hypothetical protein